MYPALPRWTSLVDCQTYDTEKFVLGLGEAPRRSRTRCLSWMFPPPTKRDQLILSVVNRNKEEVITTDILSQNGDFTGACKVFEVNGPDIKSEK